MIRAPRVARLFFFVLVLFFLLTPFAATGLSVPQPGIIAEPSTDWLFSAESAVGQRSLRASDNARQAAGRSSFFSNYREWLVVPVVLAFLQLLVWAVMAKIKRRRHAERCRRQSEDRFRKYFEMGLIGMAVNSVDKRWLDVNDRLCELLDYPRDELLRKTWAGVTHPDDLAEDEARFKRVMAGEIDGYSREKRFLRRDGTSVYTSMSTRCVRDEEGYIDHFVSLIKDISERKNDELRLREYWGHLEELVQKRTRQLGDANAKLQAEVDERRKMEEGLRESEKKYRNVVERAYEGIFILQNGKVRYANGQAAGLVGYSVPEVTGASFVNFLVPEERDRVKELYRQRVRGEGAPASYETVALHKDGSRIPVEVNVCTVMFENRPADLVFMRDIRESKQLEEERIKAGKLETIGVLAGGIAHDFNNLLTGLLGNISLAKRDIAKDSEACSQLSTAEEIVFRTQELTEQLITFSEGGSPIKNQEPVADLLTAAVRFALAGSMVRSEFQLAEDLFPIFCDRGQIRQLIINLAINAKEAMFKGGVLEVQAENSTLEQGQVHSLPADNYVHMSFRDSGNGIPRQVISKVFDPYFSTKERGTQKGMGLGLSVAYSIVKSHDGAIWLESGDNEGTTVHVYLPADKEAGIVVPVPVKKKAVGVLEKRILVMDDEEIVRDVSERVLQRLGCEVELVADGAAAIASYSLALDAGRPFDAVILDLTIPGGMGGLETLARLKELDGRLRSIVSSGFSNDPAMVDCIGHGFDAAVSKPYRIEEMGRTLQEVLSLYNDG